MGNSRPFPEVSLTPRFERFVTYESGVRVNDVSVTDRRRSASRVVGAIGTRFARVYVIPLA